MMPRPTTPTVAFGFGGASRVARLRLRARGGGSGVEVAIVFLECNRRVEQRADAGGGEDIALGPGRGDAPRAHEDDALNPGDDLLDVVRDEDERRARARHLPHAFGEI